MPAPVLALAASACLARLSAEVAAVRPSFPALEGKTIRVERLVHPVDRGRAWVEGALRPPERRVYAARLNESLCADGAPPEAVRGLIAHELAHLDSYARAGTWELLVIGWTHLLGGEGEAALERETDRAAAAAGYGRALAEFRDWQYPRLSPADRAAKERTYLSSAQLRGLDNRQASR